MHVLGTCMYNQASWCGDLLHGTSSWVVSGVDGVDNVGPRAFPACPVHVVLSC